MTTWDAVVLNLHSRGNIPIINYLKKKIKKDCFLIELYQKSTSRRRLATPSGNRSVQKSSFGRLETLESIHHRAHLHLAGVGINHLHYPKDLSCVGRCYAFLNKHFSQRQIVGDNIRPGTHLDLCTEFIRTEVSGVDISSFMKNRTSWEQTHYANLTFRFG